MTTPGAGQAVDVPSKPKDNAESPASCNTLTYTRFLQQAAHLFSGPSQQESGQAIARAGDGAESPNSSSALTYARLLEQATNILSSPPEGEPGHALRQGMDVNVLNRDARAFQDGPLHEFSYGADVSNLPPNVTSHLRDNDGNPITQVRTAVDGNGNYKMSEYSGIGENKTLVRTEMQNNVRVENGQILYQRRVQDFGDAINQVAFGRNWLKAGDLESSKQRFMDVYSSHGGNAGAAKTYIDALVNRNHQRVKDGLKAASDDQIASALRSITSIYENQSQRKGAPASFKDSEINTRVMTALKSLSNPEKYNNQGQVGSCTLNSCLFIAEMLHPEGVAKTFAKIMTNGQWRGHVYTKEDLSARNGRDSFNNMMTNAMASTFGANHIGRGFRGAALFQGRHAYKAMTGYNIHGMKQDDMGLRVTLGGAHCQVDHKKKVNGVIKTDRENWWNGVGEGMA